MKRLVRLSAFLLAPLLFAASGREAAHRPERVLAEIALDRYWQAQSRLTPLSGAQPQAATTDVGSIAVIEDDGTIVTPANAFNLDRKSVRLQPQADGSFRITAGNTPFDTAAAESGSLVPLGDDDTFEVNLGFPFSFYGQTYRSVFLNSDGNLTFTQGDVSTSERDLTRLLSGVPRIAPFLQDLDPSVGGRVVVASRSDRVTFSWVGVPLWGAPPKQTFQAVLFSGGAMEFIYAGIEGQNAVVGISPGNVDGPPTLLRLAAEQGASSNSGALAEVFSQFNGFSTAAVARRFYQTHQDAYDYLMVWSNFSIDLGLAFAFELNISNTITGIGPLGGTLGATFDFSRDFASKGRLQSVLQMADVRRFPDDPRATIFPLSGDSSLSIMGQEAGHRWLVRVQYPLADNPRSNVLLGRDLAHWSYFFNSEASVVEGNEIRDNGDGSFTTVGTVSRYGTLDQYVMGLRNPEEVNPSFVVLRPDLPFDPGHSPQLGVTFHGEKLPVTMDKVIEANGPRIPAPTVAQKDFNFAFIMVTQRGAAASSAELAKLDRFRQEWEKFWAEATGQRSRIRTALVKVARISPLPASVSPGSARTATLSLESPAPSNGTTFTLRSSNVAVAQVPAQVTVPAGSTATSLTLNAAAPGIARISATADGYEVVDAAVAVTPPGNLALAPFSGDLQSGAPSQPLKAPLVVAVTDAFGLPAAGLPVRFQIFQGAGVLNPVVAVTDAQGRASTTLTTGTRLGRQIITAYPDGAPATPTTFNVFVLENPSVPQGSLVNAASFAAGAPVSPGSLVSLFGRNLAATTQQARSFPLPLTLSGASLTVAGIAAPLIYADSGQINAQIPWEASAGTASVILNNGAAAAAAIPVPVAQFAPGLFALDGGVSTALAALHATDNRPVTSASPARPGEFIAFFATGLGPVTPQVLTGRASPASPPANTASKPQVAIGGTQAEVVFSGLAPGFAGLYQLNVQVPSGISGDSMPVVVTAGGVASNVRTIWVR